MSENDNQKIEKTEAPVEAEKSEAHVFLGIHLKKETSRWNLLAIPYVYFLMTTIGGYINV